MCLGCIERVKLILKENRMLIDPNDVEHLYSDKYLLASFVTNSSILASLKSLSKLGLNDQILSQLIEWSRHSEVTINYETVEKCDFIKQITRQVETKHVTMEVAGIVNASTNQREFVNVEEFIYVLSKTYKLSAQRGVGETEADRVVILERCDMFQEMTTRSNATPFKYCSNKFALNVSWLLRNVHDVSLQPKFDIDRSNPKCFTPRRNVDVSLAFQFFQRTNQWCASIKQDFIDLFTKSNIASANKVDFGIITSKRVFAPVVPLFISSEASTTPVAEVYSTPITIIPQSTLNLFANEELRNFDEVFTELSAIFPPVTSSDFITQQEALISLVMHHLLDIVQCFEDGLNYIEYMLRNQVIAAVGKIITPSDFDDYMRFHSTKLLKPIYQPRPFTYAIRRSPDHSPEGTVRVNVIDSRGMSYSCVQHVSACIYIILGGIKKSLTSMTRQFASSDSFNMQVSINDSTALKVGGERYLHTCLLHSFSDSMELGLELVAEARQFSSFIILLGKISLFIHLSILFTTYDYFR